MSWRRKPNGEARQLTTQHSVDRAIWSICDILRRSNCAGALQYVPELTWILFLRILDEREEQEAEEALAVGAPFTPSVTAPYRWRDWAAPDGEKRKALQDGALGDFFGFVNRELLPYLRGLRDRPGATARQKVISEILSGVERVRIDTERNMLDVLDRVDAIRAGHIDPTHVFPLSQVYEGLLLKMGEKGNDGGQFFTPREVIRTVVRVVDPRPGETVYDPGCGTGGFLIEAMKRRVERLGNDATAEDVEALKRSSARRSRPRATTSRPSTPIARSSRTLGRRLSSSTRSRPAGARCRQHLTSCGNCWRAPDPHPPPLPLAGEGKDGGAGAARVCRVPRRAQQS